MGAESVHEAVQVCGAERIGHGVRITDDIAEDGTLGHLAAYVRDNRIALEVCPTSNLQTGAAKDYASHPIDELRRLGFRITLNTDNRLVSGTTMSAEFQHMVDALGYGPEVFEEFTVAAVEAAFLPLPERQRIIEEIVRSRLRGSPRRTLTTRRRHPAPPPGEAPAADGTRLPSSVRRGPPAGRGAPPTRTGRGAPGARQARAPGRVRQDPRASSGPGVPYGARQAEPRAPASAQCALLQGQGARVGVQLRRHAQRDRQRRAAVAEAQVLHDGHAQPAEPVEQHRPQLPVRPAVLPGAERDARQPSPAARRGRAG